MLEKSAGHGMSGAMASLISIEPATGDTLWTGSLGDVDAEVAAARAAWPGWAARPFAFRVETLRRFANLVRARVDPFADLIARETGKPLWETRTEVEAVLNKVDISVSAYAERTSQRRIEGAMGEMKAAIADARDGTEVASSPLGSDHQCRGIQRRRRRCASLY